MPQLLTFAASALTVLAISILNWRCPNCRRFTAVKGRRVHVGSRWWGRRGYKYSCASCRHKWFGGGV